MLTFTQLWYKLLLPSKGTDSLLVTSGKGENGTVLPRKFTHPTKHPASGKDWGQEEQGEERMRWLDGITNSVQFSRSVVTDSLQPYEPQHTRPPCPSPVVYPNSCPLSRWYHPTISSSAVPFSFPKSFPASGSFWVNQLFASGGQSIGVSASTSVLPINTQDWSPLRWTGWISLQSKGLSGVFCNTTVQKHHFFGAQLSLQSNFNVHAWPLEKP